MSEHKCPICGEDVGQEGASHGRCAKRSVIMGRMDHAEIVSECSRLADKLGIEYAEEYVEEDEHDGIVFDVYDANDQIVERCPDFVDLLIYLRGINCEVESKPYNG